MPMTRRRWTCVLVAAALVAPASAFAQGGNPYEGDPAAIRAGRALFANRCAECHGANARGLNGPDLTVLWARPVRDERVFATIRGGVSGSVMPASSAPDQELWAIVAYLKSVSTVSAAVDAPGDAARGREMFTATCVRCHRVAGEGGTMGPDLSNIGRVRTREQLTRSIREPSASVAAGFRAVTLTLPDGGQVRGATKSEDAFSIQVVDTRGRLQGYSKADLRELVREERSLMPAFAEDRLNQAALDDLLAYLGTLR
ncbi:MAG: c-type cytochrome [Gemmatimonadetes bacterium]|nr:c-type cytochrome [Gemmatimonadota bacterium]